MNKHNSVTSTYYLLLKNKKKEFIQKYEKGGKCVNKYFEISNEKQELIDLLMNFEPSSKKKAASEGKTPKLFKEEEKAKRETSKEKLVKESQQQNKRVENIEIVPKSKSQDRKPKKNLKDGFKLEYNTIDNTSNINSMKHEKVKPGPEFQTVDYEKTDNSRNNTTFTDADTSVMMSLKHKTQKEINHIKNRRTGSTDCTNNNKLNKRDIKRIPNFNKKAVIEIDNDEGEIIVSNRRTDPRKISPSPSPAKYNIEPSKEKSFDMSYTLPGSNYESTKHKK